MRLSAAYTESAEEVSAHAYAVLASVRLAYGIALTMTGCGMFQSLGVNVRDVVPRTRCSDAPSVDTMDALYAISPSVTTTLADGALDSVNPNDDTCVCTVVAHGSSIITVFSAPFPSKTPGTSYSTISTGTALPPRLGLSAL